MGSDSKNNVCFAWYQDGTVNAGLSGDLGIGASAGPPRDHMSQRGYDAEFMRRTPENYERYFVPSIGAGGMVGAKLLWAAEHAGEEPQWALIPSRGSMSWFGGFAGGLVSGVAGDDRHADSGIADTANRPLGRRMNGNRRGWESFRKRENPREPPRLLAALAAFSPSGSRAPSPPDTRRTRRPRTAPPIAPRRSADV